MTITISATDRRIVSAILTFLRKRDVPFTIDDTPEVSPSPVVWDWEDCADAEQALTMPVFSDDWSAPENDHWDNY